MEEYINNDTVIKNEIYKAFTDQIKCQICQCLMIEPVLCSKCQNHYCKKCILKKSGTCPNKCENPIFNDVIEKNRVIKKLKFKCKKGCGAILSFDEIKGHYNSNCLEQISKIKIIDESQIKEFRKRNKKIEYVTSKY